MVRPGLNTLAYKEFKDCFLKRKTLFETIQIWQGDEHGLARRQLTWFKKQSEIIFFDITSSAFPKNLLTKVKKWYNLS